MSGSKSSYEFCTLGENGEPEDRSLHADILGDDEFTVPEAKAKPEVGPPLNEKDDDDLSDLDELEDMLLEEAPGGDTGE